MTFREFLEQGTKSKATPLVLGGGGAAGRLGQSQFVPEKPQIQPIKLKLDIPETDPVKNKKRPPVDPFKPRKPFDIGRLRVKGVVA